MKAFNTRLVESNGLYSIELTSPAGAHLKTLTGRTSNGVIKAHWNLIDDHGRRYTDESFNSTFTVRLLDSGLTQTMKGPRPLPGSVRGYDLGRKGASRRTFEGA
jgi:hypothetical protein